MAALPCTVLIQVELGEITQCVAQMDEFGVKCPVCLNVTSNQTDSSVQCV